MLSGKPRPVPSKAALHVLYQLAYISSGTAVGVGVLCAEERRRRTQVVQKIADNAKRIRQSPRYYQNAALAVEDEQFADVADSESGWVPERHSTSTPNAEKPRTRRWRLQEPDGVEGPGLPSVINQGYAHHLEREGGVSVSRKRNSSELTPLYKSGLRRSRRDGTIDADKRYANVNISRQRSRHDAHNTISRGAKAATRTKSLLQKESQTVRQETPCWKTRVKEVKRMCSRSEFERAMMLLSSVKVDIAENSEYLVLTSSVFDAALQSGQLPICIRVMLVEKELSTSRSCLLAHCEAFLKVCDEQEKYSMIMDLFIPEFKLGRTVARTLSEKAHEIIAFACTKSESLVDAVTERFKLSYRRLSESMRQRVRHSGTRLRLKTVWHTTRNYPAVQAELDAMFPIVRKSKDEKALRELTLTALDIQLSANRTDLVVTTLSELHKSESMNRETVSIAAMLFAKRKAWHSVESVINLHLPRSSSKGISEIATTRLNNLVNLFAQEHNTTATWKFVTGALRKLGFRPNQATTEIMLQSFVSREALDLIPKWLRYVRIMGYHFTLDARVAARLLTRYYVDWKPSHVLMLWFCRNLIHLAPSLARTEFVSLVKEAIGYDIRHITAGGKSASQHRSALDRLGRIGKAEDTLPSPYVRAKPMPVPSFPSQVEVVENQSEDSESFLDVASGADMRCGEHQDTDHALREGQLLRSDNDRRISIGNEKIGAEVKRDSHDASDSASMLIEAALEANDPVGGSSVTASVPTRQADLRPVTAPTDSLRHKTLDFDLLRPSYAHQQKSGGDEWPDQADILSYELDQNDGSTITFPERDMILALSLKQYSDVLALYHASLDNVGLPYSPRSLEIAVQASIRFHDDDLTEAKKLMTKARNAGMNVTCALGPILVSEIRNAQSPDKEAAKLLRRSVIDYYRINHENALPLRHDVGIAAADHLIRNDKARDGVRILEMMYRSDWAKDQPMDIRAMTMFFKGYTRLRQVDGMRWVVDVVLKENMRIDQPFLRQLKSARRLFHKVSLEPSSGADTQEISHKLNPLVTAMLKACEDRRAQQQWQAKDFGRRLVACIAKSVNAQLEPTVDMTARADLEDKLFGTREPLETLPTLTLPGSTPHRERRKGRHVMRSVPQSMRSRQGRSDAKTSVAWLKRYRAFLRRDLVLPDKRLASFRYSMPREEGVLESPEDVFDPVELLDKSGLRNDECKGEEVLY